MENAELRAGDDAVALGDVDFFDPAINDCPYGAYATLRDDAPVWFDERLHGYVITRHEDVRAVLADTERFVNSRSANKRSRSMSPKVLALYEEKGWVPAPTLAGRDDPDHREMRALFNHAFRPKRIAALEPAISRLADELIDDFIDDGTCDWVSQFAVPLPLVIIGVQMGADPDDIWRIKAWTDAWAQRLGLMQTSEQVVWSHLKGLADIATLVARRDQEVSALELAGGSASSGLGADAMTDLQALDAYRRRLADLDAEIENADREADLGRSELLDTERQQLFAELRRVTGLGDRIRSNSNDPAERARKAVSGRIRDAIGRVAEVTPGLALHLDQSIRTGLRCSYAPSSDEGRVQWSIEM